MWQTKYALAVPKNLGVGVDFRPCSEGDFLTRKSVVRDLVVHSSCQRLVAARPWDWPFFDTAFKANCGKASLVIGGNGWLIQQEANIRITRTNRPSFSGIFNILLNRNICLKNRQRVFEQVGQEITFVSSGSKHVFNKSCHRQTYQNITSNIS